MAPPPRLVPRSSHCSTGDVCELTGFCFEAQVPIQAREEDDTSTTGAETEQKQHTPPLERQCTLHVAFVVSSNKMERKHLRVL